MKQEAEEAAEQRNNMQKNAFRGLAGLGAGYICYQVVKNLIAIFGALSQVVYRWAFLAYRDIRMLNQIAAQRLRETYSGEVEGMMDISQLLDDLKIAKHAREWENAARICREGVVATETGRFADWYAFRFNLVFCLREIGDDLAIDEAISVCRGILTRAQAEGVLHKLSVVNGMLAALYENRRNGVRSQNLEAAITYHAMSLNWDVSQKGISVVGNYRGFARQSACSAGEVVGIVTRRSKVRCAAIENGDPCICS